MMNKTVHELQDQFRQLRLSETAEELPQLLREAEKASWTYLEFLESITRYELAKREAKSLEKRMKWARFPFVKSLDEFELKGQNVLTARQLSQLRELSWLEQQYNLILLGPPGIGKTYIAIGLGLEEVTKMKQCLVILHLTLLTGYIKTAINIKTHYILHLHIFT
jgi:DNA replication protein DnaC